MNEDGTEIRRLLLERSVGGWHVRSEGVAGLVFSSYLEALEAAISVASSYGCILEAETPDGEVIVGWHGPPGHNPL